MSLNLWRGPNSGISYRGFSAHHTHWGAHDHRRRARLARLLVTCGLAAAAAMGLTFAIAELSKPAPQEPGIYADPGPATAYYPPSNLAPAPPVPEPAVAATAPQPAPELVMAAPQTPDQPAPDQPTPAAERPVQASTADAASIDAAGVETARPKTASVQKIDRAVSPAGAAAKSGLRPPGWPYAGTPADSTAD